MAAAGYPNGFPAAICFNSDGSTVLVDTVQLVIKQLKAIGIDARLDQKEYGAYQAACRLRKFDLTVFGPLTPFLEPDNFLFGQYYTGEPRNRSHIKDPALDDLLVRQRRTMDGRTSATITAADSSRPGSIAEAPAASRFTAPPQRDRLSAASL